MRPEILGFQRSYCREKKDLCLGQIAPLFIKYTVFTFNYDFVLTGIFRFFFGFGIGRA